MRSSGEKHIREEAAAIFCAGIVSGITAVCSIRQYRGAISYVLKHCSDQKGLIAFIFYLAANHMHSLAGSCETQKLNPSATAVKKNISGVRVLLTENFRDPDIVYFDRECRETNRTVDTNIHQTWVMTTDYVRECINGDHEYVGIDVYVQAPMPARIYITESWDKHDYNQYDHIIAAETFRFNQKKNNKELPPLSKLTEDPEGVSDLDPNVVKCIMLKETRAGKLRGGFRNGKIDVMQTNVTGDWSPKKARLGLKRGRSVSSVQQSIHASILYLYWKGIRIHKTTGTRGRTVGYKSEWIGGPKWREAVKNYNGSGDSHYMTKLENHYKGLLRGMTDNVYKKSLNVVYDPQNATGVATRDAEGRLKTKGVFSYR